MMYGTEQQGLSAQDLAISYFRRLGDEASMQHVGVVVQHLPSGVRAECRKHRSRHLNQQEAIEMLIEILKVPTR